MPDHTTLKSQFAEQDGQRSAVLDRAREASSKTLPWIFPPSGTTQDNQLPRTFSSQTAKGIVQLASRITAAVIPFNGIPFFEFSLPQPTEKTEQSDAMVSGMRQVTTSAENQILQDLYASNLRVALNEAFIHAQITGTHIVKAHEDLTYQNIPLQNFVMKRDGAGRLIEFIYKELVDPARMPKGLEKFDETGVPRPGSQTGIFRTEPANKKLEEIFTKYSFDQDKDRWDWEQEFREENITKGHRKNNNCMVIRWGLIAGENYGRSKCDEIMGDIRSAEGLARSLFEQAGAAARGLIGVNPAGFTNIDDLSNAVNWGYVAMREEDVFGFGLNINQQIASTHSALAFVENKISEAFLMISPSTNAGRDRVTATENRLNAQQLEQGLSGFISQAANDIQIPLVFNRLEDMQKQNPDDEQLEALREVLEQNAIGVQIKTGLDALGRELDHARLLEVAELAVRMPPEGQITVNFNKLMRELVKTSGLNREEVIRSEEEVQKIQQAQQEAAERQAGLEAGAQIAAQQQTQTQPQG